MAVQGYNLEQTGQEVQGALNKIISISPATDEAPGLMSADDKAKLDALPSGADLTADLAGKVDKETGKGLSTNDFTNADKEQVEQAMPLAIQLLMDRTQDMDTIRSGAALGATAYQKPSSGIPGSDLARLRLTGLPLAGEYTAENFRASYCTLEELAKAANGTYQTASYAGMSGTSSGFTMILPLAGGVNAVFGTLSYTVHIYNATTVITVSWQNTGNTVTVTTASIPDVSQFVTRSVNDLANYYLKSETFTKAEVQSLIGAIQQFHYEIYASTSAVTSPSANVLYLIGPTGTGADKYEEYVYDATKQNPWVKIGDTSIDLSGYVTTSALNAALADYTTTANLTTLLAGKQDKIDSTNKLDYSLIDNTPAIPDAVEANPTVPVGTTPTDLQNLKVGSNYYAIPTPTVPSDLADLDDVDDTAPTDGQVLTWDSSASKWAPEDAAGGDDEATEVAAAGLCDLEGRMFEKKNLVDSYDQIVAGNHEKAATSYALYKYYIDQLTNEEILATALCDLKIMGALASAIAPLYEQGTRTFAVDDCCIYGSQFYRCITAVPTPEPFDPTKWVKTTLFEEMVRRFNAI